MYITLDDVSCLLHISIRGRLLDHGGITKDEAFEMMVYYLGADPWKAKEELDRTKGAHARFEYPEKVYKDKL